MAEGVCCCLLDADRMDPTPLSFPPPPVLCKPMFVLLSSVYTWAGATACLYFFFTAKLLDRCGGGGEKGGRWGLPVLHPCTHVSHSPVHTLFTTAGPFPPPG